MGKPKRQPSETELEILHILWSNGPCTVRDMHGLLGKEKSTVYTTVLKLMQIMHKKGFVARDESSRSHIYRAVVTQRMIQDTFVNGILERAFGGSAGELAMNALSRGTASKEELDEIRRKLDDLDK